MSAASCVVFYGLRFEVSSEEVEALESRSDKRLQNARRIGLKQYWGNFGLPGEKWLLFIGAHLGTFGLESQLEAQFGSDILLKVMNDTNAKLITAGFQEEPKILIQWQPDA